MFATKRHNEVLKTKLRPHVSVPYHPFSQTERWVWLWCPAPAATRPWQTAPTGSPRSNGSQSHGPHSRAHGAGIPEGWSSPGWGHCSHSSCSVSQSPSCPARPARWALCPGWRSARQTRRHQRTYHLCLWTKKNSDGLVSPEKHSQCHFSAERLICKQHSQHWSDSRGKTKKKKTERKRESPEHVLSRKIQAVNCHEMHWQEEWGCTERVTYHRDDTEAISCLSACNSEICI